MATTGIDLKVKRVRARITLQEFKRAFGKSRTTLWMIESEKGAVDPAIVSRYLAALETFRNVSNDDGDSVA